MEFKNPLLAASTQMVQRIYSVSYQRNGVSGTGYHLVNFLYDGKRLLGIVFPEKGHVAVIDPKRQDSSQYRGDDYEMELRKAIDLKAGGDFVDPETPRYTGRDDEGVPLDQHGRIFQGSQKEARKPLHDDSGASTGLRMRPDYGESDSYMSEMNAANSKDAALRHHTFVPKKDQVKDSTCKVCNQKYDADIHNSDKYRGKKAAWQVGDPIDLSSWQENSKNADGAYYDKHEGSVKNPAPDDKVYGSRILNRWTAVINFDDIDTEEIDVDALNKDHAVAIVKAALARDYQPGGKIVSIKFRPKGTLYL